MEHTAQNQNMSRQMLETTLNESANMLNNFVPDAERGEGK
jgi:hypothetical protein